MELLKEELAVSNPILVNVRTQVNQMMFSRANLRIEPHQIYRNMDNGKQVF